MMREGTVETDHRGLRCGVMGVLGMRLEGVNGSQIDDPPTDVALWRLRLHVPESSGHHLVGALDVDAVGGIPFRVGDLGSSAGADNRRAIDQRVDTAELRATASNAAWHSDAR